MHISQLSGFPCKLVPRRWMDMAARLDSARRALQGFNECFRRSATILSLVGELMFQEMRAAWVNASGSDLPSTVYLLAARIVAVGATHKFSQRGSMKSCYQDQLPESVCHCLSLSCFCPRF